MTGRQSGTGPAGGPGQEVPALSLGFATVNLDRTRRQGLPEVIYAPGKQPGEIAAIAAALLDRTSGPVLVTRLEPGAAAGVAAELAAAGTQPGDYDPAARVLSWRPAPPAGCRVAVVTAGTADGPVADEAAAVARATGLEVTGFRDVGVAGLHRLLAVAGDIAAADVVIVIAGMEGALASAVAGLVGVPVVAVPTSNRVRRGAGRHHRAAGHDVLLRGRRLRGQHRLRVRRRDGRAPAGLLAAPAASGAARPGRPGGVSGP